MTPMMGQYSSKKRPSSPILSGGLLCSEHNANSKTPHTCEGHTLGKVKGQEREDTLCPQRREREGEGGYPHLHSGSYEYQDALL